MSSRAIVVVDVQNEYFANGKLPLDGIDEAAANISRIIALARAQEDAVIHIRHERPDLPATIFTPGTWGVEINPAAAPLAGEAVVVKHHPNAFRETNLRALLDSRRVEEVVVVGAMSHMCIDATARAAADFGYKVVTVHDACATRDLEFNGVTAPAGNVHTAIMAALAFGYGEVIDTDAFLAR